VTTPATGRIRSLAFYLPQYHPIPENDDWWGPGFTEWRNVARARPQFPGHHQPHLPADLGFYDLRLSDTREHQAELARAFGVDGFVYYHYWFAGRRLLERPLAEVVASGRPDFPFALCWANEPWTRNWDGGQSRSVLMPQDYSAEDDIAHFAELTPLLRDPRYIRVDGKPLIIIWQADSLPDAAATTGRWRERARLEGIGDLYLCRIENSSSLRSTSPEDQGFDAAVDFQPHWRENRSPQWYQLLRRALRRKGPTKHFYHSYAGAVARSVAAEPPPYRRWPCVFPSWDNTARRPHSAEIFYGSSPRRFRQAILDTVAAHRARWGHDEDMLLFVNAWNEWAEGCHLEPDERYGVQWLEAHRDALLTLQQSDLGAGKGSTAAI
jgi:lipopolysaccharide biosynthesis protein